MSRMNQRRQCWSDRGWTNYKEVQIGATPAVNGHSGAASAKPAPSIPVRVYGEHASEPAEAQSTAGAA